MKGTVKKMKVMVNMTQKKNNHDIPFIYVYDIYHSLLLYRQDTSSRVFSNNLV